MPLTPKEMERLIMKKSGKTVPPMLNIKKKEFPS